MKRKIALKRGLPLPVEEDEPVTDDEPLHFLPDHLSWVWEAFAMLSRTRLVNQAGPQPITVLELDAYCTLEGIWTETERRDLLHHVTQLDIYWLKDSHAKIAKSRDDAKKEAEKEAKKRNQRKGK